jgi:oxygen-dependent protoporphyrinogen oxidase
VIGGGIAGLAAAWELAEREPRAEVVVLEAARAVGGKLQVAELAGLHLDAGAEAIPARVPEGAQLAHRAGLGGELISPLTTAAQLWAGGGRHPLPARTMMGVPSDVGAVRDCGVLSAAGLAGLAGEAAAEPFALEADVGVGALVRRRMGDEVVDRLLEPLLGGVYAGRADLLSLQATVPALFARLTGSATTLTAAAREVVDRGAHAQQDGPVFASVAGGLGRLPRALAGAGRFAVRTGATVRELSRTPSGFALTLGPVPAPERIEVDAVVVAVPAAKAARLLGTVAPAAGAELAGIEYASMAITTLAYRTADLPPLEGSGLLVGGGEGSAVKAVTLSSRKWPMPVGDLTLLRASVGRAGEAAVLQREDGEMLALVRHDLRILLGVDAEPVDSLVTRWGGGLPQYAVGHQARVARIRAAVAAVPGLAVCGAAYDGVGVPACIRTARLAADRVVAALRERGQ